MKSNTDNRKYLLLSLAIIYCTAWYLQNYFLLNSDVSWLIHAANLLLNGGTYSQQFLETNPPLILYLYIPAVLIKNIMSITIALRLYVMLLATLSLYICAKYLKSYLLLICLTVVYLILPLSEFGQREHLTILLITPYLLLITARIDNQKISYSRIIGVMAALGFCLKPFFLLIYAMTESYYCWRKHSFRAYFREETYFNLATVVLYAGLILCLHQDYIQIILPLIAPSYYSKYTGNIITLLTLPSSAYFYLSIIIYFYFISSTFPGETLSFQMLIRNLNINRKLSFQALIRNLIINRKLSFQALIRNLIINRKLSFRALARNLVLNRNTNTLATILFLTTTGFWLIFIMQRTNWYYHELPVLSYALLLSTLVFYQILQKNQFTKNELIELSLLVTCITTYIICFASFVFVTIQFPIYLTAFFSLFACVFSLVLWRNFRVKSKAIIVTLFIIAFSIAFYLYLEYTIWYKYKIAMTFTLLCLFIAYELPNNNMRELGKWLLLTAFGLSIYVYPFYRTAFVTDYSIHYRELYQQLTAQTQSYADKTTYYFTNTSELIFPLTDYTRQHYVSRFWSMIWLPLNKHPRDFDHYDSFYQANKKLLDIYIGFVVEDFQKYTPEVVFVDDTINSNKFFYGAVAPDFLKLFSANERFNDIWRNYRFSNLINIPPLCRFKVYVRSRLY